MQSFYINLFIGAAVAPILLFYLPSKDPNPDIPILTRLRHVDWLGVLLVTSGLALFILALLFGGNQYAWNSGVVIGFFVASVVLLFLFVLSQSLYVAKAKRLLPVQFFRRKDMVLLAVATGSSTAGTPQHTLTQACFSQSTISPSSS